MQRKQNTQKNFGKLKQKKVLLKKWPKPATSSNDLRRQSTGTRKSKTSDGFLASQTTF